MAALRAMRRYKMLAFNCRRRRFCLTSGAHCMSQTAAHLVYHVILHVLLRQRVLSPTIPLRELLATQPKLVTPVLQAAALAYQIAFGHSTAKKGELQRQK